MDDELFSHWDRCAPYLQAALDRTGEQGYTLEDIRERCEAREMQFWPMAESAVVTTLHVLPRATYIHFLLAGGKLDELAKAYPVIAAWGKQHGATHASIAGRPGWSRTFLKDHGFSAVTTVHEARL